MNAIEINGLCKSYKDFELKDITFSIPQGSIVGLVGENGAGKSTTIKLIMDAAERDSGTVSVLGTDNKSPDFKNVKNDIGIVLDEAYFPEVLTAKNVAAVMKCTYKNWNSAQFDELMKKFDLPYEKPFKDFSRGMKMKLAIAVALSHAAKLLILDEATSGLDPMVRDEILEIFNDFTRDEEHSILLSSHIVSDLEKICDYIAFIHKGRLIFFEEKDVLLEEYAILKLSAADFEAIPKSAVKGIKKSAYGIEALVKKADVAKAFTPEHTTLEEIILFLAKGGEVK